MLIEDFFFESTLLVRLWRSIEPRHFRSCVNFWCQGHLRQAKVEIARSHHYFSTRGKWPVENDQLYKSLMTYFTRSGLSQCLPYLSCTFTSSRDTASGNTWAFLLAQVEWSGLSLCSSHLPLPAATDAGDHCGGHGRLGGHEVHPTDALLAIRVSIGPYGAVQMASP